MELISRDPFARFRRAAVAAVAALAITWPAMLSARAEAPSNFSRISPSGSYLAARHAGGERDAAAAASYYRAALRGDPRNNELLGRTFLAVLADGEIDEAVKLAERVLQVDKTDRIARLVLGVRAIKQKQYPIARRELAQSVRGPITDLAATLLAAWTMASPTEVKAAIDAIDKLAGPDWYAIFKDLHAGLILDLAGQKKEAAKRFERAYKLDPTALRVVQAYGSFLSRQGNTRRGAEDLRHVRQGAAAPSADRWRRSPSSRPARSFRCWSTRRRPAPPRCCTVSAPRSAAAAARISASSICSSRSISRRRIRSRCCRSPTSMRR